MYISHIESIRECPTILFCKSFVDSFTGYGGFEHLTYRLFFGAIAHIAGISSTAMFIASFYIGIILILPVLIIFLKQLNSNVNLMAFSIFFLALYNGAGSYHGFFWVVPSFFALLLFLLIFSVLTAKKCSHWKTLLFILTPAMIYTHFIGLYFVVTLVFFVILHRLFKGTADGLLIKKLGFTLLIASLFYIPTALYLKSSRYKGNPYGIETFIQPVIETVIRHIKNQENSSPVTIKNQENGSSMKTTKQYGASIFPGFSHIETDYLVWVFPHWTAGLLFVFLILLLSSYKQYMLLSLYFSSLFFTLFSSVSIYGVRSLLLTWPLTFLIYAHGTWFSFHFVQRVIKDRRLIWLSYSVLSVCIVFFTTINIIYSYSWNHGPTLSIKEILKNFYK